MRGRLNAAAGVWLLAALPYASTAAAADAGPRFRADGPDAEAYGQRESYPRCPTYFRDQRCLVGALSGFDRLFPARTVAAPAAPSPLRRAPTEPALVYEIAGSRMTVDAYLDRNPVTGLLVARGETILLERYQYARTDRDRFASYSMAKTIVGVLVGIAVRDGAIRSIDDPADAYVAGLKGTEYGRTPIKALLRMSSGVAFRETYDGTDDSTMLARAMLTQQPGGGLELLKRFNTRSAPPGDRWSYSSAETLVLGLVLTRATGTSLSDYTRRKLWEPLGAEADATWLVDGAGHELAFGYFNAVLRDLARLGLMLAHDGVWGGKTVVPGDWLRAATTVAAPDHHLKPGVAHRVFGYGRQVWILPGDRRAFALRGARGQTVLVDPGSKLVLVQTAARLQAADPHADDELLALWESVSRQLR
jgi:CubicO group peptidase (beta-lactamase class C family)